HPRLAPPGRAERYRGQGQPARPLGPAARRRAHRRAPHCGARVMSRVGAIFWFATAMTACVVMFLINYAVQSLQDDLNKVRKQTIAEQLEIRVLHAEWSYLTQPERLAELNKRFLALTPVATKQLQGNIAAIPLRPIAEPPAEEIAAAGPAPAPAAGLQLPASQSGLDTLFAQAS